MYTIKDVAKEANVSIATVSRVINGKDKVKKLTKEKVQTAINKLNYVPDRAARTMKNSKTKTIGMLIPVLTNEYWAEMAEVVQQSLMMQGYTLIISSGSWHEENYHAFMTTCIERKIDGLILGARLPENTIRLDEYAAAGLPIVTVSMRQEKYTSITGDDINCALTGVNYLIGLGHKRIAYIGSATTGLERELGYRNALMLGGLPVDERIVLGGRNEYVDYFSQYGYQCALQLVESRHEFSAIFCSNDLIAIGALKALDEQGIKVPEDVSIIGVDDISMASFYRPSLTTLKQPIRQMAETAVEMILKQIDKLEELTAKHIVFPMKLVIRESTAAPRK